MDEQDKELISLIFKTKPANLVALNREELRKYLVALSQYYTYFIYQVNLTRAKYFLEKKTHNDNMIRKMAECKEGKTVAEKQRIVCDSDESLENGELMVTQYEAELKLLEGLEKPIIEYINVIKRLIGEATYHGQRNE